MKVSNEIIPSRHVFEFTTQLSTYSLHSCLCRLLSTKCVRRTNEFSIYSSCLLSSSECVCVCVCVCNYLCEVIEMSWFLLILTIQSDKHNVIVHCVADHLLFIKRKDNEVKKLQCKMKLYSLAYLKLLLRSPISELQNKLTSFIHFNCWYHTTLAEFMSHKNTLHVINALLSNSKKKTILFSITRIRVPKMHWLSKIKYSLHLKININIHRYGSSFDCVFIIQLIQRENNSAHSILLPVFWVSIHAKNTDFFTCYAGWA